LLTILHKIYISRKAAHTRRLRVKLSKKQKHIKEALEKLPYNKLEESNSRFGIITSGVSYLYAKEAVASLGIEASFLKIGAYPPSENMINKFLEKLNRVLIIEELTPFVEEFVRVYTKKQDLHIWGKLTGDVPETGEFSPDTVKEVLSKIFRRPFEEKSILPDLDKLLPPRPPVLCAGCPHRATFYAISQVFGKKAIYPSDIGCYTLGLQMGGVDTCLCMGASITISSGLYKSGEKREIVCTIGDSTFLHTGIPGLINAVYNNSRIVVVILDNETTAMTGYQPHPGTGITAQGEKTHKVSFEKIVRACGVSYVETIDPYNLTESIKVFKRVKEESGVRVVIAKRVCALLAKKLDMKRVRFEVTEECIGCQKCLKFGCPAIEWNGEKAQINEQCSGCGVCAQICPVNSIRKKNNEV